MNKHKRSRRPVEAGSRKRSNKINNRRAKLGGWLLLLAAGIGLSLHFWRISTKPNSSVQYRPRPQGTLTFNKDIAPIVFTQCAVCHRPGQSAPFGLLSYQEVKKHAPEIATVTQKRIMPPWLPEPGYGEFAHHRGLSAQQIGRIQQWVKEGAIEGLSSNLALPPAWTEGWQLGEPDLIVRMPQPYQLPPAGKDVYRNFVIPIPIAAKRYVKAVEFLSDNPRIVHHAFMKVDRTPQSRRLDEQDPEPGFSFMITPDTAQMPEGHFLSWTPGTVFSQEPDGLAWPLDKGTDLVLQMHLNPTGKPESIQASVGFHFTNVAPTNTPFKILLTSRAIDVPAGEKQYVIQDSFVVPVDIGVVAVLPHAHYLAKEMQGFATLPNGRKEWLILIKDWNFNWQGAYRFAKPVNLPRGSTLSMQFTYDNSGENPRNPHNPPQRVTYGPQTTDEMAELWFQVLPRNREDLAKLAQAFQKKMLGVVFARNQYLVRVNPKNAEAHNKLGQALVGFGRTKEALEHLRAAVKLQPDYEEPHFFLGYILRDQKKLAEARSGYETVLRINPTNHEAYGNLGLVCFEQGNLAEAEEHFRSALRINPNDAVAKRNLQLVLNAGATKRK